MFDRVLIFNCEKSGEVVSKEDIAALEAKGISVATNLNDAVKNVESARFFFPILIAGSYSDEVQKFFHSCSGFLGGLNEFFVLITNDPDPRLQGAAYELGVKNVWPSENTAKKICAWIETLEVKLKVEGSTEALMLKLGALVARAKRGNRSAEIEPCITKLLEEAKHDYRVAYLLGVAFQAIQHFEQAEKHFALCLELNSHYIPAVVSHAQLRLQNASPAEALKVLEKLEMLNNANSDRKALLAAASADSGNWDSAKKYLAEAEKLEPGNSRVKEMKVRVAFESGNVAEALALLDTCDQIDEYFITKLNDQAIGLSKNGKTQDALNLYHKAHGLASTHIKFKISYNIALAYKRQNDFLKALEMLDTVDKEVGTRGFEKSAKLRAQIKEEMAKR